jgi:hypothetical protein
MRQTVEQRFLKAVRKDKSGCWLWQNFCYRNGYGEFYMSSGKHLAHRASYTLFKGKIPDGLCVLHRCDVRNCVNPDHLWLGTVKENQVDMAKKGRSAIGDRNGSRKFPERLPHGKDHHSFHSPEKVARGSRLPQTKLTEKEVLEIRKQWKTGVISQPVIAEAFGIAPGTVSCIVTRKIWKHVA